MIRTPHLVAYYPFEGNGNDASGRGHHASEQNGPISYVAGKFGRGADLENDNTQYFQASHHADLMFTTQFTIAFWIKFEAFNLGPYVYGKTSSAVANGYWGRITNAGQILSSAVNQAETGSAGGTWNATALGQVTTGAWYHIATTYNGGEGTAAERIKIYVNGTRRSTTNAGGTIPTTIASNTSGLVISGPSFGRIDGITDEWLFYDKALPESDIRRIMIGMHPLHG